MSSPAKRRVYWIDALKTIVVVGIALFHSALVFTPGTWLVNNPQRSLVLGALAGFTFQWGIALLFLLAGAATWFGLRSQKAARFAASRIARLGLPLLVGLALLSPLQWYFQHAGAVDLGGLLRAYVSFWATIHPGWYMSSYYDVVYHLWFLTHLILITIATLPVVLWLRSSGGRRITSKIVWLVDRPGGFLLGAVPFAVVLMVLHGRFPLYEDRSDLAVWAVLYVEGFILISDLRIAEALARRLMPALLLAVSLLAANGLVNVTGYASRFGSYSPYSPGYFAYEALLGASTWSWLVVLIGIGVRWLDHDNVLTRWGAAGPLPFYVLSHPIIVVLAKFVVGWDLGVWAKFGVVAALSIGITLALCELVTRHRVLRTLFGLKSGPPARAGGARSRHLTVLPGA